MKALKNKTLIADLTVCVVLLVTACGQAQTNLPPTVAIVSPSDGTISYTTNSLIIDVQAADADGTVTQVTLYQDGAALATADSSPYEFELINLSEGTNTYTASAVDDGGAVTFSAPVRVTVLSEPPSYYAPYITFSAPASNAVVIAPTNLTLVAQISDLGFPVRAVNFGANNTNLGSVYDPPFSWTITNIGIGSYSFVAIVTDAGGNVASSPPLPVTVIPNPATTPAVSVVSPTNGTTVPVGQNVPLAVSVTPNGNAIKQVDFYVANNLVGSVSSAPYTLVWQPSIVGPACWDAVAEYGQGQTATSANSCVNVTLVPGSYPQYVVVDLGPLETNSSSALGLNSLGHFVGDWPTTTGTDQPYLDIGGVITLLNTAPLIPGYASALNDADQILINANQHGYIYQQGQVTDVGSLGGTTTFVRSINASGQVVGDSQTAGFTSHAFLYGAQKMTDLAPTSSGVYPSQANAINDLGTVVGWATSTNGQFAFTYDAQHGLQAIPDPPGGSSSAAWAINNLGSIAGNSYYANTATRRAFVNLGGATIDLGTLGDQFGNSGASGINNSNQVVGFSQEGADQRGFLWMTNVLYDLNLLIPINSTWSITTAYAINDAGQIVGTGRFGTVDRSEHAVLLNPVPGQGRSPLPPVVNFVAPTNNAVVPSGTDVPLAAAVIDQDGYVTNVAFYAGGRLLGSSTNPPPFTFTWTNAPAGIYELTAVATDNLGASQTSAPITLSVRAPYPGAPRIAVLSAATDVDNEDIRKKLINTLLFDTVDVISVTTADPVPSLARLLQYNAVLVYDFQSFNAPAALGDLLGDFEDAGHGVVLALYAGDTLKYPLAGRLITESYLPWAESGDNFAASLTLVEVLPQHPILSGVQTFNGGQLSYYQQNVSLAPGSLLVANWSNGQKLVAARQVGLGRLVGLNFFPVSSDIYSGWWQSSTDGARLIGNALLWAATPPAEAASLSTSSNVLNYLPGQNITLSLNLTNFSSPPAQVDIYTNNSLLITWTNSPFSYTWQHPALGNYLTTAVVTDAQTNTITTRPLALSVDSRLTITLLSPTNGAVIYYPTNLLLQVAASDLDAPILYVDYFINGSQFLASVSNAPYSFNWNVDVVDTFTMNAVATDALGAQHSSTSNLISVIQYDPNKPVQTFWIAEQGDWLVSSNWSLGVPRPQDTAWVDSGGTALLASGFGTASNLTIGLNSTGAVLQTTGKLSIGQSLTLGQNTNSTGYFELDGPGQLSVGQLFLGSAGSGHFVQNGGTNVIKGYFDMAGNLGGQSVYDLFGGQLIAPSEYIGAFQTASFYQHEGTNTVQGLTIGGMQPSVTGVYYLVDGLLSVGAESINAQDPAIANLIQFGGTHRVSQTLSVGDQGQGLLAFAGGNLTSVQLVLGLGASVHVTVGGQTNGIQVSGKAQFNSTLFVHLAPNYTPAVGDTWPIVSYGSYQGTFARVILPPATNGVAWQLSYLTNQLVVTATKLPNIIVVSPVSPTTQSNLFYQIVQITNPGAQPLAGARVFVPGLPAGTQVYNAAGTVAGVPYVEYDSPIARGQTVQFYIQLLSTANASVLRPNIILDVSITNEIVNPEAPFILDVPSLATGRSFAIGFNSELNQSYYIQYSSDLNTWRTVSLPIIGVGSHLEWIDDGPPKTDSLPQTQAARFYRAFRGD